jgi:hypothetical protein
MGKRLLIRKRRKFAEYLVGEIRLSKSSLKALVNEGVFDVWEVYDEETGEVIFQSPDKNELIKLVARANKEG